MATLLRLQTLEMGDDVESPAVSQSIAELRAKIPPQILGHYDRMMARGKKGIAIVRNGVCRECHVKLAIGALQVLRHGTDIQICGNCGRYLCLEEDVATAVSAPVAPAIPKPRTRKPKKAALEHAR
ncbi:MAG: hypothetical protein JXQ71_00575 [Verrucomicrobia bacterium]|nr:hypothetical protein [Verrucomicrobiota bacterium]